MRRNKFWMAVVCGGSWCAALGGCGWSEGLTAVRDEAVRTRDIVRADRERLESEVLASSPDLDDRTRATLDALIETRRAQEASFDRAIEQIGEAGADPAGTLETGAAWLAPLLPPGTRFPVVLGVGLAASLWRAVRLKTSAASIAEGLEKAMRGDPGFREGFERNAATIRSIQTRTAHRIVDEVKGKPLVRLPI